MADDDTDDTDNTEDYSTMAMVDPVAAAIALSDLAERLCKLYNLATNSKANKARLRALAKLNRRIADAEAKLAAIEADAAEIVTKAENEVRSIHEDAQRRRDAAESAEQDLRERERRIQIFEADWRFVGEAADVISGRRSAEHSPLQKARMAHGLPPGKDPDPLFFSEPDAALAGQIDASAPACESAPHAGPGSVTVAVVSPGRRGS
jgi:hypothetical protein